MSIHQQETLHNAQISLLFYCVLIGLRLTDDSCNIPAAQVIPIFCHARQHTARRNAPFAKSNWLRVFDGEMKAYVRTQCSLSLHRSGVIFHHICRFALFPTFLQACPFVKCWMWDMHHTGHCQTLPSGPLMHRSTLRKFCIHFDSHTPVSVLCLYVCDHIDIYPCVCDYVCMVAECRAPACICVFVLFESWAPPAAAAELVIARSGFRAMETNSADVTSPPGWVLTDNFTATPLRD